MIAIAWWGMPQYAARAIGEFVTRVNEKVVVLRVPGNRFVADGASGVTHCPVIDVANDDRRSIVEVAGEMPRVILAGGWAMPCFVRWAREVKKAGGLVILGTDEAYVDSGLRQTLRKWRFKLAFGGLYDKVFVVGQGGLKQFVDYYGMPADRVFTGFYGSDPAVFFNGAPLGERPKRFLYVGHFDANKNVVPMCEAFLRVRARHPDWELELCGGGELEGVLPRQPGIVLTGVVKNTQLGEKYRNARCLVLGSFSEKWGVVVHEACASGCLVMLSTAVGSRYDFARPENSATFDPADRAALETAYEKIIAMDGDQLKAAQAASVACAQSFSPQIFAERLLKNI